MTRCTVMGSGSWGTAFAMVLADAGATVTVWGINEQVVESINTGRGNPDYHPGIELPASIRASTDATQALADAELVVVAVPAQALRSNLSAWGQHIPADAPVLSLMKGIEWGTMLRMTEVIAEVAEIEPNRLAALSGPNLAREIAQRQPAATVIASASQSTADAIQRSCFTSYFRPYTNTDLVGTELAGSIKNVVALATGMAAGMGFGDNTQASLITRGLAEMTRLGLAMGADLATFMGLAGVGDLIATCSSSLSRNRTFGENLGRGLSVAEVEAITKQTSEGVKSCQPIHELAGAHQVEMPITAEVVRVVHEGVSPRQALADLMARQAKPEAV
jgi:glycerol-3-phosphate dehydrogenase (NAD(P)+)